MSEKLSFVITARAAVDAAVNSVKTAFSGLRDSVKGMFSGVGNWFGLQAMGQAVEYIKGVLRSFDELKKGATAVGIGVEAFQALQLAGKEAGLSGDEVVLMLQRLKQAQENANSDEGMSKSMEKLGKSLSDLSDGTLQDAVDALSRSASNYNDIAPLRDIFGGRNPAMIRQWLIAIGGDTNKLTDAMLRNHQISSKGAVDAGSSSWAEIESAYREIGSAIGEGVGKGQRDAAAFFAYLMPDNGTIMARDAREKEIDKGAMAKGKRAERDRKAGGKPWGNFGSGEMIGPPPPPKPSEIIDPKALSDLDAMDRKILDATATDEQRIAARQKAYDAEIAKLGDAKWSETERARISTTAKGIWLEIDQIQKESSQKALAADKERARLAAEAARSNESSSKSMGKEADFAQRAAEAADRRMQTAASAALSETSQRYEAAKAQAEEAFQTFMDPARQKAKSDEEAKRATGEEDLQRTYRQMVKTKPRDWMTDKEKAAMDTMTARSEATAAAALMTSIDRHLASLDAALTKDG